MPMVGGLIAFDWDPRWEQWVNAAGQTWYYDNATMERRTTVPPGFEDQPGDTWYQIPNIRHWTNTRTGRVVYLDPKSHPARNYLDDRIVATHMPALERIPGPAEQLCLRAIGAVLKFLFRSEEGYEVVVAGGDRAALKVEYSVAGPKTVGMYDFMLIESGREGCDWEEAVEGLRRACKGGTNASGEVYGLVQVGMMVQFFRWRAGLLSPISAMCHLREDVEEVTRWAEHLGANHFSFV